MELNEIRSDEEIVQNALHDKDAFAALVARYQERLSRYIQRIGVSRREDIEDLLQEVFLKAYRNLNGFNTRLRFSSWIYRIAHNETVSFFRAKSARPEAFPDDDETLARIPSVLATERLAEGALNAARIAHALSKLEQKYRDVIVLRYFEERDYAEISDVLKIPSGTVATLLNRGKKKLKELLNEEPRI